MQQGEKLKAVSVEGGITEHLLRPSALTSVTDHGAAKSHLRAIAAAKRKNQPSPRWYVHRPLSYASVNSLIHVPRYEFELFLTDANFRRLVAALFRFLIRYRP